MSGWCFLVPGLLKAWEFDFMVSARVMAANRIEAMGMAERALLSAMACQPVSTAIGADQYSDWLHSSGMLTTHVT